MSVENDIWILVLKMHLYNDNSRIMEIGQDIVSISIKNQVKSLISFLNFISIIA